MVRRFGRLSTALRSPQGFSLSSHREAVHAVVGQAGVASIRPSTLLRSTQDYSTIESLHSIPVRAGAA